MDLNDINIEQSADDGAELRLEHPVTSEALDIVIRLSGVDSAAYRQKQKELNKKRMEKLVRGKKFDASDEDACELLASVTLGWSGLMVGGEELKFSESAARDLYSERHWIREQVDLFVGDRANFFAQPSKRRKGG